ncbi:MAG: hypothetical protein KJP03_02495, partial [Gammaproteobacteria bacterium]|nr:hypothetical protein [Gammaproteobacteria bacterium]
MALTVLSISTSAQAGKSDPRAAMLPENLAQSTYNEFSVNADARVLKALIGVGDRGVASRGGICGNSLPDLGESCDDGNTIPGDGCSATCQIEDGAVCTEAAAGINVAENGSFADGGTGWTTGPARGFICGANCTAFFEVDLSSDGDEGYVLMGSGGGDPIPNSFVEQVVSVPAGATTLTFDWFGASTEDTTETPGLC